MSEVRAKLDELRALRDEAARAEAALRATDPQVEDLHAAVRALRNALEAVGENQGKVSVLAQRLVDIEQALANSDERIGFLIGSAFNAIVVMDGEGKIGLWNPAAEKLFGWTSAEAVGQELAGLIIPDRYRAAHRAGLQRFRNVGDARVLYRSLRTWALRKEGPEFEVELLIGITRDAAHGGVLFMAYLRDLKPTVVAEALDGVLAEGAGGG